jgi:hypothetical protein
MSYFISSGRTLFLLGLMMILFSCKKEVYYEALKGELKGRVGLTDNSSTITDYSGVSVILDGSSPGLQTTTNAKGEYNFTDVKTGIYDIVFSKEGYGTYKLVSYQFIGGNIPTFIYPISLGKVPDFSITSLQVDTGRYSPYTYFVNVTGKISVLTYSYLRVYLSDRPDVSYTNYQATDVIFVNNTGEITYNLNNIISKYPKGKQLYIIVYPGIYSSSSYIDLSSGNSIYTINTQKGSAIIPFTIPNTISYY